MKLQGMGIVFVLIAIPLILVLSYYIQLQVDTISIQTKYDNFLLGATYDAMSSFEINTANEDLSTVSDSLRTIIEASSNVFINTLATNLGYSNASKSYIEPYIPALLYTLYDGYYISSPTKVPKVLTNSEGNAVSVGDAGVSVDGSYYLYDENNSSKHITYKELNNKDDYGQLLYLKNGETNKYTANISEAEFTTKNVLKTYMPYSARYKRDKIDVVITYSLDNFITVEGTIDGVYYAKSGYLLPKGSGGKVTGVRAEHNRGFSLDFEEAMFSEEELVKEIREGNIKVLLYIDEEVSGLPISLGGIGKAVDFKENFDKSNIILETTQKYKKEIMNGNYNASDINNFLDKYASENSYTFTTTVISEKLNEIIKKENTKKNEAKYQLDNISSAEYYAKAATFSNWVYQNLGTLQENDLQEISGQSYFLINGKLDVEYYNFDNSTKKIFDLISTNQNNLFEIDKDSVFYNHKLKVIRESIQYNLNLAMSTYNNISKATYDYYMPVILNDEWEMILSNPSITSFMQGYKCGLKTYNNYKIVSSTNNEIFVSPENIFYVKKDKFSDEQSEYHRIDCPNLFNILTDSSSATISFSSKEVKYDKIYNKSDSTYNYDHKNLSCYTCINDGNYKKNDFLSNNDSDSLWRKGAYYKAVGKERNNLYKMNSVEKNGGYEIIYYKDDYGNLKIEKESKLDLISIQQIEIVYGKVEINNASVVEFEPTLEGNVISNEKYTIVTNSTQTNTMTVKIDSQVVGNYVSLNNLGFNNANPEYEQKFKESIQYVKVIYK